LLVCHKTPKISYNIVAEEKILLMTFYKENEDYFNKLNITEVEAQILIGYLTELSEIGINNFINNEMKI
jgi:hypothetical protein